VTQAPSPVNPPVRRVGLYRAVVLNLAVLVLTTLLLNAVLVWNMGSADRVRHRERLALQTATLLAEQVQGSLMLNGTSLGPEANGLVQPLVTDLFEGDLAPSSLIVVDTSLRTVAAAGDTGEAPMVPTELREAVLAAHVLTGTEVSKRSFWGRRQVYAAVPIQSGAHTAGGVRAAFPIGTTGTWIVDWKLVVFVLYCAVAVVIVSLFGTAIFRSRILHPIQVLMVGTAKVAEGMFSIRVPEDEPTEIGELASSFNQMAEELERYQARSEEQVGELQHINELLERTRDELAFQARMAGVGRLAAGVAHEIGNPLSAVIGLVDLLRDSDLDEATHEDLLRRIADELQRVHATVRDLLDYARPAEGETEPVDLAAVLQSATEMVSMQKEFDRVVVTTEVAAGLPAAIGEPSRLRQVLINLLLNARDAVDGEGAVALRALHAGDRCVIEVADDGPGVAREHADSIFDPFFTTKEPGAGTGLGLSVSLQIVEGFGGRLRYRPGDTGGAVFIVDLAAAES
jgi:two-component system, NtrC family, sensor kinase